MDNDTQESENTICTSSYRPNSVMFITHMKASHIFGSRRHNVLGKSYGSDSKEQRAQVIATNKQIIADIVEEFNQAFSNNAEIDFGSHTCQCSDIEKIEIMDGDCSGKDYLYTTVANPNT